MIERGIIVRKLAPKDSTDVAQIIALLASHINPNIAPLTTAATIDRFGPTGAGYFDGIVAEQSSRIIGLCLHSIKFSGWRGAPGVFISDLYVDPSLRGAGLGRRLLRKAAENGLAKGCSFLQLEVDADNDGAIAFYTRLGFNSHQNDIQMFLEEPEVLELLG